MQAFCTTGQAEDKVKFRRDSLNQY